MMPIFAFPGEITPGQLGPISRDFEVLSLAQTFTMSSVGMPSVMQTISGRPASSASRIASAANGGGTKITVALAPVFSTASATVLKTGQPSCVVPPFPGVTPPTTTVPYSAAPLAWNVPSLPVIPCTISRVFLSTSTAMLSPHACGCFDNQVCSIFHRFADLEIQPGIFQNLATFFNIGSFEPEDDRNSYIQLLCGCNNPCRQSIHAKNPAENINEDGLHVGVGKQNLERVLNLLLR